jgi:hypothetical protein
MRAPSERDQCQAKLDILVEGFMHDDMPTYRDALAWLRTFADRKNVERGRVMCGSNWFRHGMGAARKHALENPTNGIDPVSVQPALPNLRPSPDHPTSG